MKDLHETLGIIGTFLQSIDLKPSLIIFIGIVVIGLFALTLLILALSHYSIIRKIKK